jgi:hypothetical protein
MISVIGLLVGCTLLPEVQYKFIEKASDMKDQADAFYPQQTTVTAKYVEAKDKKVGKDDAIETTIELGATPSEYRAKKIGIKPVTTWRSKTSINLTKKANTDLMASAGVEVEETLVKNITDYGGALVKVIALAAVAAASADQPCLVPGGPDVKVNIGDRTPDQNEILADGNAQPPREKCVKVTLGKLPPDAIKLSEMPVGTDSNFLYYSACRDATISVVQSDVSIQRQQKTVRVSDPLYVQMLQFPPKGSITLHSECGASVQTEKSTGDNMSGVIGALAAQGKAIKDAIDAAKKNGKDTAGK